MDGGIKSDKKTFLRVLKKGTTSIGVSLQNVHFIHHLPNIRDEFSLALLFLASCDFTYSPIGADVDDDFFCDMITDLESIFEHRRLGVRYAEKTHKFDV